MDKSVYKASCKSCNFTQDININNNFLVIINFINIVNHLQSEHKVSLDDLLLEFKKFYYIAKVNRKANLWGSSPSWAFVCKKCDKEILIPVNANLFSFKTIIDHILEPNHYDMLEVIKLLDKYYNL